MNYEEHLLRLAEYIQSRHPVGQVKHIGLLEAVDAAVELLEERRFDEHLRQSSATVATWPQWKQSVLGGQSSPPKIALVDWLVDRAVKTATIVRKNGRIGEATRLDWPLLRIVAQRPVWDSYGKTCVFLNTYDPPDGVHGRAEPSHAWQVVIITGRKCKKS